MHGPYLKFIRTYKLGRFKLILQCCIHVFLPTAEQYSPERNTWMPIPDMTLGRSNFAAATFGNKIVVIGGYDGNIQTT